MGFGSTLTEHRQMSSVLSFCPGCVLGHELWLTEYTLKPEAQLGGRKSCWQAWAIRAGFLALTRHEIDFDLRLRCALQKIQGHSASSFLCGST